MKVQEQHFDLGNGRHLAAKVWGESQSSKLICLHGWLDNAASFDQVAPELAQGRQLVAVDMVGHGFSDHIPAGSHYYVWEGVEDMLRLLEVLGIQQADIIGHSLGGAVSAIFAGTFPDKVRRLALIEAIGPYAMADEQSPELLASAIEGRLAQDNEKPACYKDVAAIVKAKQIANGLSEPAARAIVERNLECVKDGFCWRSDARLRKHSTWRMTEHQLAAFFARIEAETLLILGNEGMFADSVVQHRMAPLKSLKTVRLPGHHHLHMEEDTAPAVVSALQDFFVADA